MAETSSLHALEAAHGPPQAAETLCGVRAPRIPTPLRNFTRLVLDNGWRVFHYGSVHRPRSLPSLINPTSIEPEHRHACRATGERLHRRSLSGDHREHESFATPHQRYGTLCATVTLGIYCIGLTHYFSRCRRPKRRLRPVQSHRIAAFQADDVGSIPIGRSLSGAS